MKYTPEHLKELRLIIKFMGGEFFEIKSETDTEKNVYGYNYWKFNFTPENDRTWMTPSSLYYQKRWDWIMPVVLQICSNKQYRYSIQHIKYPNLWVARINNDAKDFIDEDGSKNPIESTYKAVVLFLKWIENIV